MINVSSEDVVMIWCIGVITVGWLTAAALNTWRLSSMERQWRRLLTECGAGVEIIGQEAG